ncbi:unnamed protein product [Phytomonas sp. Hart1]|nr:unnamed protein product [Phytomonas sp. Hart1]|eukprot:CCW66655.1 unnamed protein product [Phytomonas sp. isolate Hart1]
MNTILPYTVNPTQMRACERLRLLNPNSAGATGPNVAAREQKPVCGGLLNGWDAAAARVLLEPPGPVQTWDLAWTDEEADWEAQVHRSTCPEEVEALLPARWIGYHMQGDVDGTLARVCRLCTALVQRFVALSAGNNANASTAKWRQRHALYDRLGAVMELLEASIGGAIPILKLQDTEFIRKCWEQLQDDERMDVISALGVSDDDE